MKLQQKDTAGLARTHHNLGLAWSHLGDHGKSLHHFDQEFELLSQLDDQQELNASMIGRGMALHGLGRPAEAAVLIEKGLQGLGTRHVVKRASGMLHLGLIDMENSRSQAGIEKMRQAFLLSEQGARMDLQRGIAKELAKACDKVGDATCAALYWKTYSLLSDSLAGEQQQWAMEEMQARYESREKERTIHMQEMELEDQREQRTYYLLTVILATLLLLASLVYGVGSLRNNRRLKAANARAGAALNDRELLLKEMHHRVKNNLQMLNSLLSIQSRALKDPGAREAMLKNRERVQAIGLIHQFLYTRDSVRRIDMRAYLKRLLEHLSDISELEGKGIVLRSVTESMELDVDVATPMGLIVNELVTNSIKHAFPQGAGGTVTVTLRRSGSGLLLQVEDDGCGAEHNRGEHGFGQILLETLAGRLGARMEVVQGGGTSISLHIPLKQRADEIVEHTGGRG